MKEYQIIYADPPWEYRKSGGIKSARGLAKKFYSTMSYLDIAKFELPFHSSDSALFLWTTSPCLQESFYVIKEWGFEYVNIAFVWIKKNTKADSLFWGMGNFTRANAEFCLFARKGKLEVKSRKVHSVIMSKIEKHSKKPDEARDRIVQLFGDLPRIELFARQRTEGWDVLGNQLSVEGSDG